MQASDYETAEVLSSCPIGCTARSSVRAVFRHASKLTESSAGNYQPNAHDMVPLEMLACLPLHCCSGRVRRHAQEAALVVGGLQVLRMEAETFARHALVAAACVGPPRISALTFDLKASAKGKSVH